MSIIVSRMGALARAELERRRIMAERKEDAEKDLLSFVRLFWPILEPETDLVEGWVLEAIADYLMAVTDGYIKRGLINVSPGSMKSLMLNVFWPAWEWGPCHLAHLRYLSLSYSAGLTERDNGRFLRVITDPVYRRCWGDVFATTKVGIGKIENDRTGWKQAGSVRGSTAGFRADRVLLDDANDPNTVESKDIRDGTNLFLREVMPDRLNSLTESVVINMQQRTHTEDATGTLSEYGSGYRDHWLCIPMEFDPLRMFPVTLSYDENGDPEDVWQDPRGLDANGNVLKGIIYNRKGERVIEMGSPMAKAEGTLAWPERFPPDAVDEMRRIKGPYAYANQYQQEAVARGGGIIRRDWWNLWPDEKFPDLGTTIASLDTAYEEKSTADFNALTVWGAFPGPEGEPRLMLTAAWHERLPLAQLVARVAETCIQKKVDYLIIEHKSRGRDVHDEIRRLYATATWQTILVKVSGSKEDRLNSVSHLFSGDVRRDPVTKIEIYGGGIIYAPDVTWADEVIEEVANFPRGAHDDYVDTVSMALGFMRKNGVVLRKVEHDAVEAERKKYKRTPGVPYAIGKR